MSNPDSRHNSGNQAVVFAALGDATRLSLIAKLCDAESLSVVQLTKGLPLTRQAVSKHLRVLETAGIVRCDRIGRESHYAYVAKPVSDASAYLRQVSQHWDGALSRLKSFVEE
jgi:DNA-binding transcriptional ArsR family regulator